MTTTVTKEGVTVKVGQVWKDLDKRMPNRLLKVVKVYGDAGKANLENVSSGICSQVAIRRMHKTATGYALVSEPAA
jgi:hypothetical protein